MEYVIIFMSSKEEEDGNGLLEYEKDYLTDNLTDFVNEFIESGFKYFELFSNCSNCGPFGCFARVENEEIVFLNEEIYQEVLTIY